MGVITTAIGAAVTLGAAAGGTASAIGAGVIGAAVVGGGLLVAGMGGKDGQKQLTGPTFDPNAEKAKARTAAADTLARKKVAAAKNKTLLTDPEGEGDAKFGKRGLLGS